MRIQERLHDWVRQIVNDGTPSQVGPSADELMELAALLDEAERVVEELADAATGLSHGTDWNNGTHAKTHGYRRKLLAALPGARAFLAKLRGECNILEETTQDCPRHGYSHTPEQPNGND